LIYVHYSEPEAQLVRDVAAGLQPHVWLNVHSGMEAMFVPWDHLAEVGWLLGHEVHASAFIWKAGWL
jgi:hypothetical protein